MHQPTEREKAAALIAGAASPAEAGAAPKRKVSRDPTNVLAVIGLILVVVAAAMAAVGIFLRLSAESEVGRVTGVVLLVVGAIVFFFTMVIGLSVCVAYIVQEILGTAAGRHRKRADARAAARSALVQRWSRVRLGLPGEEVAAIFGQPRKIKPGSNGDEWSWGLMDGSVVLRDGKVAGWAKPRGL